MNSSVLWEPAPVDFGSRTREYIDEDSGADWWWIQDFFREEDPPMAPGLAQHHENLRCMLQDVESPAKSSLLVENKPSLLSKLFLTQSSTEPLNTKTSSQPPLLHQETFVPKPVNVFNEAIEDDMPILQPQSQQCHKPKSSLGPGLEMPTLVAITSNCSPKNPQEVLKPSLHPTYALRPSPKKRKKKLRKRIPPQVDLIDGVKIFSFTSESELRKYTSKRDYPSLKENLESQGKENIIVPTKTRDITQIKGWRTKYFCQVPSPEEATTPMKEDIFLPNSKKPKLQAPEKMIEGAESDSLNADESQNREDNKLSVFCGTSLGTYLESEAKLEINFLSHFNPNIKPLKEDSPIFSMSPFFKDTSHIPDTSQFSQDKPPPPEVKENPVVAVDKKEQAPVPKEKEGEITPGTSNNLLLTTKRVVMKIKKDASDENYKVTDFNLGEEKPKAAQQDSALSHGWVYQGMETTGNLIQETLWSHRVNDLIQLQVFLEEQKLLSQALECQEKLLIEKPSLKFPVITEQRAKHAVTALDFSRPKLQAKKRKYSSNENAKSSMLQKALESSQKLLKQQQDASSFSSQEEHSEVPESPSVSQGGSQQEGSSVLVQPQSLNGALPIVLQQHLTNSTPPVQQQEASPLVFQQQRGTPLIVKQQGVVAPGPTTFVLRPQMCSAQIRQQSSSPLIIQQQEQHFVNIPAQILIPNPPPPPSSPPYPIIVSTHSMAEGVGEGPEGEKEEPKEAHQQHPSDDEVECLGTFPIKKTFRGGEVPLIVINSSDSEDEPEEFSIPNLLHQCRENFEKSLPEVKDMNSITRILQRAEQRILQLQRSDEKLNMQKSQLRERRQALYTHYEKILKGLSSEQKKKEQIILFKKLYKLNNENADAALSFPGTSSQTEKAGSPQPAATPTIEKNFSMAASPTAAAPLHQAQEPAILPQNRPYMMYKIGGQRVASLTRIAPALPKHIVASPQNADAAKAQATQLYGACKVTRCKLKSGRLVYVYSPRQDPEGSGSSSSDQNLPPLPSGLEEDTSVWFSGDGEPCIVTRLNSDEEEHNCT